MQVTENSNWVCLVVPWTQHYVETVTQVMEEGEVLSKKQLTQESTIKKLRTAAKEAAEKYGTLQAELASQNGHLRTHIASAAASDQAKQVTISSVGVILY